MIKTYLIFTFLFLSIKVFSFTPGVIDTLEVHKKIKSFGINERLLNFKDNFFEDIVFESDSIIYYNPQGTLILFKIKLSESVNVDLLSNGVYHGNNFKRNLFIHNHTVYSIGGEGLFNIFPGLIYFDTKKNEWFEKKIKGYPPNTRKILNSWKLKDKIILILNLYSENYNQQTSSYEDYSFGEIDLKSFEYINEFNFKNSTNNDLTLSTGNFKFYTDNYDLYGFMNSNRKYRYDVFDKQNGELFRISFLENSPSLNENNMVYINNDFIYQRNEQGLLDSVSLLKTERLNVKNYYKLYRSKKKSNLLWILVIGSLILITLIGVFFFKINNRSGITDTSKMILDLELVLVPFKGKSINKEELDKLLNISHYSYETIKTKRSSLLKEINERGTLNVERVRKQDDKRYFEYKIS